MERQSQLSELAPDPPGEANARGFLHWLRQPSNTDGKVLTADGFYASTSRHLPRRVGARSMDALTPALQVRTRFRSAFYWLPERIELDEPKRYRSFLRDRLDGARDDLARTLAGKHDSSPEAARSAVFVIATGLSTYGDLESAQLGLENVPTRGLVRELAGVLRGFLPLPANVDPVRDPIGAASWLGDNRKNLVWIPGSHFAWKHATS